MYIIQMIAAGVVVKCTFLIALAVRLTEVGNTREKVKEMRRFDGSALGGIMSPHPEHCRTARDGISWLGTSLAVLPAGTLLVSG